MGFTAFAFFLVNDDLNRSFIKFHKTTPLSDIKIISGICVTPCFFNVFWLFLYD